MDRGLKSVEMIAKKYEGMMGILTDGQMFTVKILLRIPYAETEERV